MEVKEVRVVEPLDEEGGGIDFLTSHFDKKLTAYEEKARSLEMSESKAFEMIDAVLEYGVIKNWSIVLKSIFRQMKKEMDLRIALRRKLRF